MRLTSRLFQRIAFVVVLGVFGAWAQTDGVWQGATPQWSDSANWEGGVVPGDSGSAVFKGDVGVSLSVSNDVPGLVLGGLSFSSNVTWVLQSGYPITLAADVGMTNTVHVERGNVELQGLLGPGAGVLRKIGVGCLNFPNTESPFNGSWLVEQDRLEIRTGTSLMTEPAVYRPDALILNGGAIKNYDSSPVFPLTMGITLLEHGGSFAIGWSDDKTLTFASPITGPGTLFLSRNNGRFLLSNPANDYAGGTVVGTNGPGYHISGAPYNLAYLQLAADGVLPYGVGKGGLTVDGAWRGVVDLAGTSNRMSELVVTAGGIVTNRVPTDGALYADALALHGVLTHGTRIVWCGGAFDVQMADGVGAGVVAIPEGATLTVTNQQALGGATLLLDGSALTLYETTAAERAFSTNNGAICVGPGGGTVTLTGCSPLPVFVAPGGVTASEDNLSDAALAVNTSVAVGSSSTVPALFDAAVTVPADASITFRDSVWVRRLPHAGTWTVAPGVDAVLEGDALAGLQTFLDAGSALRVVTANLAHFDGGLTLDTGETTIYDTRAVVDGAIVDSPLNTYTVTHPVTLNGGTLTFSGQGSVTHAGVIAGNGVICVGSSTTALTGNNTFSGSVTVDGGTLLIGNDNALGAAGNVVTLTDSLLSTASGTTLTLPQAVSLTDGGFYVDGGSLRLSGGLTVSGVLDKQGSGELIIESASLNAPDGLALNGGAVVLEIAADATYTLEWLAGTADLIVRGGGRFAVGSVADYSGSIVLENGVLLEDLAPASHPVLWLDASAAQTLVLKEGTSDQVVRWNDVRDGATGSAHPYAWLNEFSPNLGGPGYKTALPPVVVPSALEGQPVLDFGVYHSGQWLEFGPVANARTFFWVIGSQNSGGMLIGSPNKAGVRGGAVDGDLQASEPIFGPGSWVSPEFRESQVWVDRLAVNPTITGLSGGYQLVTALTTGEVTVNGLAKDMRTTLTGGHADGAKRSGGQRLAEVLIYDRVLTEEERQTVEVYLMRKWLGGSGGMRVRAADLTVSGTGGVQTPHASVTVPFERITGSGTLTKLGAGTILVEAPELFNGTLALAEGTFTVDGLAARLTAQATDTNPVPGAAFWVDANVADSFGTDAADRVYWRDVRWDGTDAYIVATQRWAHAPVLLPNEIGALAVVDLGPTNTPTIAKGLQWSRTLENVRTVFWVIGSQQGGGVLLGSIQNEDNTGDNHFARGPVASAATPLFWRYAHGSIKGCPTRIDGVSVDNTMVGLSGGYQVVALRTTGDVMAGQFAHDRWLTERGGGQRLGEVIVYTNALSDTEMAQVEAYLMQKWQRPFTRDVPAMLNHVAVPAEGEPPLAGTLHVGVRDVNVGILSGTGLLTKTGAAPLSLFQFQDFAGWLDVVEGRVSLAGCTKVERNLAFWADASRGPSLVFQPGSSNAVIGWRDARDTDPAVTNYPYAFLNPFVPNNKASGYRTALPPTLEPAALNGRAVLDFGAWRSGQWLQITPVENARTIFWVLGSQQGGGLLLGSSAHNLIRGPAPGTPAMDEANVTYDCMIWNAQWSDDAVRLGETFTNGVSVGTGTSTPLNGGYQVIATRTTAGLKIDGLAKDMRVLPGGHADGVNRSGGQKLAELLIYDDVLTDIEMLQVGTYLATKWGLASGDGSGTGTGGASAALMTLTLREGTELLLGGGEYELGTFGGAGAVSSGSLTVNGIRQVSSENPTAELSLAGPLTVNDSATWHVAVGAGSVVPLRTAGGLTFMGGGTVTITDATALPDEPTLLAEAVDGASLGGFTAGAWTVIADDAGRQMRLVADGNAVYVVPSGRGTVFLVR